MNDEIHARIELFKEALLANGIEQVLDDFILKPNLSILGAEMESSLVSRVCQNFKVDAPSIFLVGSAKLGFSTKPGQYFKHFSGKSDIDIAIVSKPLFTQIWQEVFEMELAGEYFDFAQFKHYHYRGWIRPDKVPSGNVYRRCREWWEFFSELSSMEDYLRLPIRGGLYYDKYFLRQYQLKGLLGLKDSLVRGNE
jgi:hypothetical protein